MDSFAMTQWLFDLQRAGVLHELAREVGRSMAQELHRLQTEKAAPAVDAPESGRPCSWHKERGESQEKCVADHLAARIDEEAKRRG